MMNNGTQFWLLVCGLGCLTYCVSAACDDAGAPTSRPARAHLAVQVKRNVAAGSRTLAEVTQQSKYLDGDAPTEFEQIVNSVRSAGQRPCSALNQLQSLSEDAWPPTTKLSATGSLKQSESFWLDPLHRGLIRSVVDQDGAAMMCVISAPTLATSGRSSTLFDFV